MYTLLPWTQSIFRFLFFFNDTATTEIYTLSLHDALPILGKRAAGSLRHRCGDPDAGDCLRSEEHTSELQSQSNLVCRLLLENKKKHKHKRTVRHKTSRIIQYIYQRGST